MSTAPSLSVGARVVGRAGRPAAGAPLLGPHYYYDIIRLARKGWPTLLRVLYLGVLLLGLLVMYETQGNTVHIARLSEVAQRAHQYAFILLLLQYLLVLVLMPVYVASAIAEEKENRTLEALSLTHLTDRELVLGKLAARLTHVGMIVLSAFPLLVFMRLWGNVDINLLLYHEINTLLLLVTAGSICIWVSTRSQSVFQALTNSYPPLIALGFLGVTSAFALPWLTACLISAGSTIATRLFVAGPVAAPVPTGAPVYLPNLLLLVPTYLWTAYFFLRASIGRMDYVRLEEARAPKKVTGAFTLSDRPAPRERGRRRRNASRIHPLALPVGDHALFWKESLKDGSGWSLSYRWPLVGLAVVMAGVIVFWTMYSFPNEQGRAMLRYNAFSFAYTAYFIALAAYVLVVLFQTTMAVAGEREQDTLVFLLLIPEDRRAILVQKWLGPMWRNWPILAISYLGALFGFGCGLYNPLVFLLLLLLPWPLLLMVTAFALWLSVVSRRVLFANIGVVGFLGGWLVAHLVASDQTALIIRFYVRAFFGERLNELEQMRWGLAAGLAGGEQALFLALAAAFGALAFWRFRKKEYASAG